ncbi:DUF1772 domain-containing protein [Streptomyces armeniacus]|uniref:DUF1772 domain-containing protein n=1 Tax=Streptomyces armeniacus TaxID=83291 RepID=A0A345XQJ5_9ACTN|nr:anthrone oxygenase family protein [Streptomyces armeniacus]AXK33911.1 DUF1772 domain-containing protein [Streptomyces armeniacus]
MWQAVTLAVATVLTGLMAGIYAAFSIAVMPGLARVDDAVFVRSVRSINVRILNGWFLSAFLGALVFSGLAAVLHLGDGPVAAWAGAGCALYAGTLVTTFRINVPLNDALEAALDAGGETADPAPVRARFEAPWTRWNAVRAVLATAALGCLVEALILHGNAG